MLLPLSSRHLGGACCSVRKHAVLRCWASNTAAAAAARSAASSEVAVASPTMELLSADNLQQYIDRHGIQASLVPLPPADVPPSQIVKSMVLMIKDATHNTTATAATATATSSSSSSGDTVYSAEHDSDTDADVAAPAAADGGENVASVPPAVLVLLTDEVRVDERAVAQHLGLPRRRLRLASRQEAAAATGYEVGSIPPFGHLQPLRTLVDASITRQLTAPQQQQQLYAGGGAAGLQLLLSAEQLLAATAAEAGVFSEAAAPAAPAAQQQQEQQLLNAEQQQQQWALQLPLPWPPGSSEVQLIGVVAQRRRIAKLLLFCSLVPESVPPLPADGTAAYVRRLWQHPDHPEVPCEVQVIMGKTIERKLGREEAAALMDHVKVGSIVLVKGRVQQNPAAASAQSTNGSSSSISSSRVLDVVAHELQLLHKSRDVLSKSLRAAQRRGATGVTTAAQLLELQQQQQLGIDAVDYVSTGHGARTSSRGSSSSSSSSSSRSSSRTQVSAAAGSSSSSRIVKAPSSQSDILQPTTAAATDVTDDSGSYWQLPQEIAGSIHWVNDEQGITAMQQLVLPQPIASSSSSSSGVPDIVVGMDCEWRPYEKHSAATPVALLQLATREHIFLVDLLAICEQQRQQVTAVNGSNGNGSSSNGSSASSSSSNGSSASSSSSSSSSSSVSAAEAALSRFLLLLLSDPRVVKLGFALGTDLDRLQQSYPHLPCFQPGAAAAAAAGLQGSLSPAGEARLASYIDLLQLARAAVPSLVKLPHISLSKLVNALLGKPLDKTEQTSAWDVRPLSNRQLDYAAKDAYVLTVLFDAVLGRLHEGLHAGLLAAVGQSSQIAWPVTQLVEEAEAEERGAVRSAA